MILDPIHHGDNCYSLMKWSSEYLPFKQGKSLKNLPLNWNDVLEIIPLIGDRLWVVPSSLKRTLEPRLSLAEEFALLLGVPVAPSFGFRLIPQRSLNKEERIANVPWVIFGKPRPSDILIDDVWTTGATIQGIRKKYETIGAICLFRVE